MTNRIIESAEIPDDEPDQHQVSVDLLKSIGWSEDVIERYLGEELNENRRC